MCGHPIYSLIEVAVVMLALALFCIDADESYKKNTKREKNVERRKSGSAVINGL